MSSTNRGRQRNRDDYYITPVEAIVHFLNHAITIIPNLIKEPILDPCAGGSKDVPMSYPVALQKFNTDLKHIFTVDIRDDSKADIHTDYLTWRCETKPKLIITNPPFSLARDFIEKALHDVDVDGYVVMLLRLNFFGSQNRKEFWQENMPCYTFVHSKRMSFTMNGKTDSIEYMHCIWRKNFSQPFTKLFVI